MELTSPTWFRFLLDERDLTPAAFAKSIGVTPATIHRLLRRTRTASPALAQRIATALDLEVSALFRVPVAA
jgi:plasmid maintenance system antidote protein VapI